MLTDRHFPYSSMQEINLDWILTKVKNILRFVPDDGAVGQILRRTAHGAEWSDEQGGGGAVSSVNGQTGAVVLTASDVGALPDTYAAPVDSVNGQTGTVVLPIPSDTSDLTNTAGFVNAAGAAAAAPVQSVNGQTGAVVLGKSDVGLGSVDNVQQYSASNPPPYPVTSVNGQTGAVTLAIPTDTGDLTNGAGYVTAAGAAAAAPVQSVNGQTGAVTVAGSILTQAPTWVDAYNNAQSIIAINAQDTSGNNWVIYIPKALVTTSPRVWGIGDFHTTNDFNNFAATVTTTTCSAQRIWRNQYPQSDAITYWYM